MRVETFEGFIVSSRLFFFFKLPQKPLTLCYKAPPQQGRGSQSRVGMRDVRGGAGKPPGRASPLHHPSDLLSKPTPGVLDSQGKGLQHRFSQLRVHKHRRPTSSRASAGGMGCVPPKF